jgi:hypothetical protein
MLAIPEMNDADAVFGNISLMPKFETLPAPFKCWNDQPYCNAVSQWFFNGAKRDGNAIVIDGKRYVARLGVDTSKAINAIGCVLRSFAPKHEHKIAACGYMLSEWFELQPARIVELSQL